MSVRQRSAIQWIIEHRAVVLLTLAVILSLLFVPFFATEINITQALTQFSFDGIIAIGLTILMITWVIDLSVGSTMALGGLIFAMTQNIGVSIAAVLGMLSGGLVGLINGLMVTRIRINFFIATLATMVTVRGLVLVISDSKTIYGTAPFFGWMGEFKIWIFEFPVLVFFGLALLAAFVMNQTRLGTYWYAIGGSADTARRAGLPVGSLFALAFVISGLCSGLAGVLLASRTVSASPTVGRDTALFVISATVIGGTSLFGGRGSISGAVAGVLLLGLIRNALNLLTISAYWQWMVQGIILVVVVVADVYVTRQRRET